MKFFFTTKTEKNTDQASKKCTRAGCANFEAVASAEQISRPHEVKIFCEMQKGFTLLETLFSILIFSAALVALMTIAARGISATESAQQETVAHYLAQEGLETVRNIRDTNYDAGTTPWDTGFSQCIAPGCKVVYGTQAAPTLAQAQCPAVGGNSQSTVCTVNQDPVTGEFNDGTTNLSAFSRSVIVTPVPPTTGNVPDAYTVTSNVTWTFRTIPRVVSLATVLKNWQ
jgi:prepilin-type N-terminal cleavage/methylation domain-containing protein